LLKSPGQDSRTKGGEKEKRPGGGYPAGVSERIGGEIATSLNGFREEGEEGNQRKKVSEAHERKLKERPCTIQKGGV